MSSGRSSASKRRAEQIKAGQTASLAIKLTQEDFNRFARLSGDDNPIHVDPEFTARTRFRNTVAHGMFLFSLICRAIGARLPGPGSVLFEQQLMFPTPAFAGEEFSLRLEVIRVSPPTAEISTVITRQDGEACCQGQALVRLPGHFDAIPARSTLSISPGSDSEAQQLRGLYVGQTASTTRVFTFADRAEYAQLVGDHNPIYTTEDYAKNSGFPRAVLPPALLGSLFSYLLGTQLPGRGTNWLKQTLRFPAPAYPNVAIKAVVKITRLRPEKSLVNLLTICMDPDDQIVCEGEALVLIKELERSTL